MAPPPFMVVSVTPDRYLISSFSLCVYQHLISIAMSTKGIKHLPTLQITGEDLIRRSDDNEATLRKRLETYHAQTKPLVEFYSKLNLHVSVDASKKPDDVWKDIEAAVKKSDE